MTESISRQLIPVDQRMNHTNELFGVQFPLLFEPFVYVTTERLSKNYTGG